MTARSRCAFLARCFAAGLVIVALDAAVADGRSAGHARASQELSVPRARQEYAPALVRLVEGSVDLYRGNIPDRMDRVDRPRAPTPVLRSMLPLVLEPGDLLVASTGRVEIVTSNGALLHVDAGATVEHVAPLAWRLHAGRASITQPPGVAPLTLEAHGARLVLEPRGRYEVDRTTDATVLRVGTGRGIVSTSWGSRFVEAGHFSRIVPDRSPSRPRPLSGTDVRDGFVAWSEARGGFLHRVDSTGRLPASLRSYAPTLERHGTWRRHPRHGAVWYPTVASGWAPYSAGAWVSAGALGIAWRGRDPFSWPTHHFGRWGRDGRRWFWKPTPGFAAAPVQWVLLPRVVGWRALGVDTRPPSSLAGEADLFLADGAFDPPPGWTLVDRDAFTLGRPVQRLVRLELGRRGEARVVVRSRHFPLARSVAPSRGSADPVTSGDRRRIVRIRGRTPPAERSDSRRPAASDTVQVHGSDARAGERRRRAPGRPPPMSARQQLLRNVVRPSPPPTPAGRLPAGVVRPWSSGGVRVEPGRPARGGRPAEPAWRGWPGHLPSEPGRLGSARRPHRASEREGVGFLGDAPSRAGDAGSPGGAELTPWPWRGRSTGRPAVAPLGVTRPGRSSEPSGSGVMPGRTAAGGPRAVRRRD